jgi:hypothetical protein
MQVRCEVSPLEHQLATTNPRELAQWHAQAQPAVLPEAATVPMEVSQDVPAAQSEGMPVPSARLVDTAAGTQQRQGVSERTQQYPQQLAFRRVRMHALSEVPAEGSQLDES